MVETSGKKQNQGLIEGQRHDAPGVLLIGPLFPVVDGLPEDEVAVQGGGGQKLEFRHGDHVGDHVLVAACV